MSEVTPGDERDAKAEALTEYEAGIRETGTRAPNSFVAGFSRGWDVHAQWQRGRVSPVTREDVQELISEANLHDWGTEIVENYELPYRMIQALESLSVSPPAEVEWGTARRDEAGNLFDEWSYTSYERAVFDIDNSISEEDLVLIQRTKGANAGPWVPVTPGEGKGGHDEGCADFYVEYGAPENGVCHVCGEEVPSSVRGE